MVEFIAWAVAGLLFAGFIAANYANIQLLRGKYVRPDGTNPSPVLFVGGILGVLAVLAAPVEAWRVYWWVPLVVDLGTGPYLLVTAFLFVAGAFSSRSGDAAAAPAAGEAPAAIPAPPPDPYPKRRAIVGCLLGTAVGDALGLACEGLSRRRQLRMFPDLSGYKLLPFGKGMCSDDTEHSCMLAQTLVTSATRIREDEDKGRVFGSRLGWRLRFWLLGMPAGIGLATLRAILKLWVGFPARYSGVFSAGNGAAMRVALLGVCYGDDPPVMRALVRAATRVTHTDPKAEHGALAVALAAHLAARGDDVAPGEYARQLRGLLGEDGGELCGLVDHVARSVEAKESAADYAARNGGADGIGGYVFHTVPAALHVWLAHQGDYRGGVTAMVRLGGDSDTSAAIVGAIIGARTGKDGIPAAWLRDLWEWPRNVAWMEELGTRVAQNITHGVGGDPVYINPLSLLVRNAFFIPLVLAHGFRRLLPPY